MQVNSIENFQIEDIKCLCGILNFRVVVLICKKGFVFCLEMFFQCEDGQEGFLLKILYQSKLLFMKFLCYFFGLKVVLLKMFVREF